MEREEALEIVKGTINRPSLSAYTRSNGNSGIACQASMVSMRKKLK